MVNKAGNNIAGNLKALLKHQLTPLDLLPHPDLREKLIDLVLNGEPVTHDQTLGRLYTRLLAALTQKPIADAKVVVFGGGTGLSNVIGGDSRLTNWAKSPFAGLKEIFPHTRSVVCVTDDGGSTGELLKDLPIVAIGDIRRVLISSIQLTRLQTQYGLSENQAKRVAEELAKLFNLRFVESLENVEKLKELSGVEFNKLPDSLAENIQRLIDSVFTDSRLRVSLSRANCLGNLLVCAAVFRFVDTALANDDISKRLKVLYEPLAQGLKWLSKIVGAGENAVLPCTPTPCQLRVEYSNGIQTTGESKSSLAQRGVPVQSVYVDYCDDPYVYQELLEAIENADILILAPGSLYSSIIPVFKVPAMAEAVRKNTKALKLLISNLWVQAGETDLSISDPERKFRISDMIEAYERNIPGGTAGLFDEVLCLSLKDVPASVIQSYAVEGKIPIYLDREVVKEKGYKPIECGIFSRQALNERGVIQHDPATVASAVQVLYAARETLELSHSPTKRAISRDVYSKQAYQSRQIEYPLSIRFKKIAEKIYATPIQCNPDNPCKENTDVIRQALIEIIWKHHDIPLSHLNYFNSISCIPVQHWRRDQQWDNVFSYYDPDSESIMIRSDQYADKEQLEIAFLIALGESLLGDYALKKEMKTVEVDTISLGKVYHLHLLDQSKRKCFFSAEQLGEYLRLARMCPTDDSHHYTRLINGVEGFTPPGVLMGLMYAWYLENRLASHIEYKMAVMRIPRSNLIPEQKKMVRRRKKIISFFRDVVFI